MTEGNVFVFSLVLALGISFTAYGVSQYLVTDLGTLGGPSSYARAINMHGEVAGYSNTLDGNNHAFLWLPEAAYGLMEEMNDLGPLPGYLDSFASGVNSSGEVAGKSEFGITSTAVSWQGPTGYELDRLGGELCVAEDININARIVGYSEMPDIEEVHAVYWEENGTIHDLGLGKAYGINSNNEIVGRRNDRVFLWLPAGSYGLPAGMNDLGTLLGYGWSVAEDINDLGQITGTANGGLAGSPNRVFLWLPEPAYGLSAGMNDLTGLNMIASAYSVNNLGQVVGEFEDKEDNHELHAFLWEEGGLYDINDLIPYNPDWKISSAEDINDLGQVVGCGINPEGQTHAVLLTPLVPLMNLQIELIETGATHLSWEGKLDRIYEVYIGDAPDQPGETPIWFLADALPGVDGQMMWADTGGATWLHPGNPLVRKRFYLVSER